VDQETIDKRKLFKQYLEDQPKIVWTEEQLEKIKFAAKILAENKKECEKFKGRDGI
jgi:hypothetical protein